MTSTVAGPAAACSRVPAVAPPLPLPHETVTIASTLAMLNSPHLRTDFIIVRSSLDVRTTSYSSTVSAAMSAPDGG